jgi:hypothetical protein
VADLLVGGHTGTVAFYKGAADATTGAITFTPGNLDVFGLATKKYVKSAASPSAGFGGGGSGSSSGLLASLAVSGLVSVAVGTVFPMVPGLGAMAGKSSSPTVFVLDAYAAPNCADMDGDGDLDCLVGFESGSVALFENVGTATEALWSLATADLFLAAINLPLARKAAPFMYDWDMDGDFDVLVSA